MKTVFRGKQDYVPLWREMQKELSKKRGTTT